MSDFEGLKARLLRAARDGRIPSDRLDYETPAEGVARLVDEIGGTVIARRLQVDFGDGSRLRALVSGRRIMHLPGPAPAGLAAELAALFDREGLAAADAAGVGALLAALCGRAPGFVLSSDGPDGPVDPTQAGVPAEAIAAALGLARSPGSLRDGSPEALWAALSDHVLAAALLDADGLVPLGEGGDAAEAAALIDWGTGLAERILTPDFALFATLETAGILVFAGPTGSARHHLVAGRNGRFLLAALAGDDASRTIDTWRGLVLRDPA